MRDTFIEKNQVLQEKRSSGEGLDGVDKAAEYDQKICQAKNNKEVVEHISHFPVQQSGNAENVANDTSADGNAGEDA